MAGSLGEPGWTVPYGKYEWWHDRGPTCVLAATAEGAGEGAATAEGEGRGTGPTPVARCYCDGGAGQDTCPNACRAGLSRYSGSWLQQTLWYVGKWHSTHGLQSPVWYFDSAQGDRIGQRDDKNFTAHENAKAMAR